MQISIDPGNKLRLWPETPKEGFQLGSLQRFFNQPLAGLLYFPDDGPDMVVDASHLTVLDELLGTEGSPRERIDRIKELLSTEKG